MRCLAVLLDGLADQVNLVEFIRAGYTLSAAGILAVSQVPALQCLVAYGRGVDVGIQGAAKNPTASDGAGQAVGRVAGSICDRSMGSRSQRAYGLLITAIEQLATYTVPHSWFLHFYVVSLASALLWAQQIYAQGPLFRCLARWATAEGQGLNGAEPASMSLSQIIICWSLLAVQSVRRLAECLAYKKPSASRMWVVHWMVGIAFYFVINIAIWVEGIATMQTATPLPSLNEISCQLFSPLSNLLFLVLFILASGIQHDCHHYLASLPRYTLPVHDAFRSIISPHYTAECIIYLSLAGLAAPQGHLVNKTVLAGAFFVVVNLGVSAGNSKGWYERKFGAESVRARWRMVPGIY
ncbi:hypothetical protein KEM52_005630 [Ascosphaera acerosa]|nr:hypothetical protein KEM52_005630 [Ascosphaera acerosa]